jgi:hypothetical protein
MAVGGPGGGDQFDDGVIDDEEFERALEALAHWAGDTHVVDAVSQRRRSSWLARQAEDETTLSAVLVGLGERACPATVGLTNGRRHQGIVALVGSDVIGLRTAHGQRWLALSAVAWLRTSPGRAVASGSGPLPVDAIGVLDVGRGPRLVDLASELADLALDRARVAICCEHGDETLVGALLAAGRDVLTLRDDGGGLIYVALASVVEVSLPESG